MNLESMALPDDRLLSRKEAAAFLGISPDTLATWKCRKKNPLPIVRVGSLIKYKISDLRRFIEERVEIAESNDTQ